MKKMNTVYLFLVKKIEKRYAIVEFNSCADCAIFLRVSRQAISQACNDKFHFVKGFEVSYDKESLNHGYIPANTERVEWSNVMKKCYLYGRINPDDALYDPTWSFLDLYRELCTEIDYIDNKYIY